MQTICTMIRKRDGREVSFDALKIENAIKKAAKAVHIDNFDDAENLAAKVSSIILEEYDNIVPTVEQIQDVVERVLIDADYPAIAKAYILYRQERARSREMNTRLMKIYEDLTFKSSLDNDIARENANIDGDTAMGTMLKYGSEGAKQFYDMFVLKPEHAEAHRNGDIHIHDLDFLPLTTTCCQIDLIKLFHNGFSTGHGFLREPNDIISYSALAAIAIQSNQNDQHGGQSIPNFDYAMAIGVTKTYRKMFAKNLARAYADIMDLDDENVSGIDEYIKDTEVKTGTTLRIDSKDEFYDTLADVICSNDELNSSISGAKRAVRSARKRAYKDTDRRTYQAMEAFIHNLNTMHSRAGAQVPFSSINYGTDTSAEGRMVIRNLLLTTEAGLGNGETPIFPVQIFKVKDGVNFNHGEPNYDLFKLSMRVSAKRLFPNYSFIDAPFNLQYYKTGHPETEIAYMGCRTRVAGNHYDPTNEIVNGRGNLSFTSINLPRLGIKHRGDISGFYAELDEKIDLVIAQLLHRFELQSNRRVYNSPFLMGQGVWIGSEKLNPNDKLGEVLKHGTLSMGFIGLAETLVALIGQHHGQSADAQALGLKIVGHMRERAEEASERYGLNFSVIATPAEGLSGRFVRMDKERFGVIKGVTDRDYYTNSFHIPVYYPINAHEKIKLEAPYHELTNGGHISYVELDGDPTKNLSAFESVIRCMKESGIGYGSVNHPVDRDPVCGYTGIIGDVCPKCGRHESLEHPFERIRRITGYLVGTLDRFNNAKRAEEHDRVKHLDCDTAHREMEQI